MARTTTTKTTDKPSRRAPTRVGRPVAGPSRERRLGRFLREVRVEMGKVTWPSRRELIQATMVVLVAVAIASAYIGILDVVWSYLVSLLRLG